MNQTSITECHHFIRLYRAETLSTSVHSFVSFTSAPGLLWNEVTPCRLIPFTTGIDSLQSSFGNCYATRDSSE